MNRRVAFRRNWASESAVAAVASIASVASW